MDPTLVWNGSPEIARLGFFTLRWYNLLFLTPFIVTFPILYKMFARAGKPTQEADSLRTYVMVGVILGARLGHVIFYEWSNYKDHLLEIFLPITFYPTFKIVGFQGLASHGALIGVIIAVFLYLHQIKVSVSPFRITVVDRGKNISFLWISDHLFILAAFGAASIRVGNFMNSEIIGKPTGGKYGVVFARHIHDSVMEKYSNLIEKVDIVRHREVTSKPMIALNHQPIQIEILLKKGVENELLIKEFLESTFKKELVWLSRLSEPMIYESYESPLSYTLSKVNGGVYKACIYTAGILRHPAQLYESISCFLLFIFLLWLWYKKGDVWIPGQISGIALLGIFVMRFLYEFYKENQDDFEKDMLLNMGQRLSMPFILIGLFLLFRAMHKSTQKKQHK